jgi:hypothetical protein
MRRGGETRCGKCREGGGGSAGCCWEEYGYEERRHERRSRQKRDFDQSGSNEGRSDQSRSDEDWNQGRLGEEAANEKGDDVKDAVAPCETLS